MRGKLPFVDEDPENYNESQKKVAKFFDNIIEFFVPEEDEQENDTENKSCTESTENTEQEESTESQSSKSMSGVAILLKSIKDSLFAAFGLLGIPALITACVWTDAGDYSRGIMLKGNAVFAAVVFFIAFAVQYSDLSHTKAKTEGTEEPLLSRFLSKLVVYTLTGILLCILIAFVYICGRQDAPDLYDKLPFGNKVEQLVEKGRYFVDDLKAGAYEYVDSYEVKLTKVGTTSVSSGSRRGGSRTKYIYTLENASGDTATFADSGKLYEGICEGYEEGDKIPLPITITVDLMEKDGEQYYFYNDNKLERIS